jgi:hypothetical protein
MAYPPISRTATAAMTDLAQKWTNCRTIFEIHVPIRLK